MRPPSGAALAPTGGQTAEPSDVQACMRMLHNMLAARYLERTVWPTRQPVGKLRSKRLDLDAAWFCLLTRVPVHRYGPRVRMGIYEGVPTSVCPHSTSGRADYWGPFVNRAARFANAAAQGGQIMVPAAVGRALVAALTRQDLSLEGAEPVLLVQPDFVPQKLKQRPSVPWIPQGVVHPLHMRARRHEDSWLSPEVILEPAVAGICSACGLSAYLPRHDALDLCSAHERWHAGWRAGLAVVVAVIILQSGLIVPTAQARLQGKESPCLHMDSLTAHVVVWSQAGM